MSTTSDVAVIGLAVMGRNLALNLADRGHAVAVHNRSREKTDELLAALEPHQSITGHHTLADVIGDLSRPRRLLLMVQAGAAVDAVLDELLPMLDEGDIVVDGGNSRHSDTARRVERGAAFGVHVVGAGVSGGEEGARHGPSIMPGGSTTAWPHLQDLLQSVAATAGPDDDEPCCDWIGPGGSGHYVKMIHNGIEYGDMQVLAEAHGLLSALGYGLGEQGEIFGRWNEGRLRSYLVEITASIMEAVGDDGRPVLDSILDAAGQKGTGRWTVEAAMHVGQPMLLVAEAVGARMVSANVEQRNRASHLLTGPDPAALAAGTGLDVDDIANAIHAAKLVSYAQGFLVLAAASDQYEWDLNLASIARLWRGGCIIRARFLDDLAAALAADPPPDHVLLTEHFAAELNECAPGLRRAVNAATNAGLAVPAFGSALAYYDGLRNQRSTANLIQAQRDYFGAHTYERVDRARGEFFHTDWAGTGGTAVSGSYSA